MKISTYWKYKVIIFLFAVLLFIYSQSDADLGWHLRYGEYFLKTGQILKTNEFSYSLENYIWINHSWVYDVIVALFNQIGGFNSLSILGASLIGLSLSIILPARILSFPILLLAWYVTNPLLGVGLKSHYFSLFFFIINFQILQSKNKKIYLLLPLIFFLWSNIHGQFLTGLGILWIYLICDLLFTKKINKNFLLIALLSSLATLLNPWGIKLHLDIASYLGNPLLSGISEWMPWPWGLRTMIFYLIFIWGLWLSYLNRKQDLARILIIVLLSVMAIKARRFIPYATLVSLPLIGEYLNLRLPLNSKTKIVVIISTALISLYIFSNKLNLIKNQTWQTYCQSEIHCSEGVVNFMAEHQITGKLFNAYRLGGHLIYRYPHIKVFIDGRMTLWHDQTSNPFQDYQTMIYSYANSRELFHSYEFDYALLNHEYPLTNNLINIEKWPIIYQDEFVVLLINPRKNISPPND